VNQYLASKKEAAEFFCVSVQALDGWFTAGCPVHERDANGRIKSLDLAAMAQWRIGRAEGSSAYEVERTRLTKAQADKTELEVQELRGILVRVPSAAEHWRGMVARARAKLLSLPSRIAAAIAPPEKVAQCQDLAQGLVYEALAELAGDGIPDDVRMRAAAIDRSDG
jgi:phage terminase Nu1 subunit (DNA packaging protein)